MMFFSAHLQIQCGILEGISKNMTVQELKDEIYSYVKPKEWRDGQFVFNMIDHIYGVARIVQFNHGVDCFYNDDKIEEFFVKSVEVINDYNI